MVVIEISVPQRQRAALFYKCGGVVGRLVPRASPVLRTAVRSVRERCDRRRRKTNMLSFGLSVVVGRFVGSVTGGSRLLAGWPAAAKSGTFR